MRLIDADAVWQKIQLQRYDYLHTSELTFTGLTIAKKIIEEAPTIEATPVVHGRWMPTYHTYYNRDGECRIADEWHCSKCEIYSRNEWHYCPNCGAKMDGEKDG